MNYKDIISILIEGTNLTRQQASLTMQMIMSSELTSVQVAALAVALRAKGETEDEIAGLVDAMRQGSLKVKCDIPNSIDTCGTGGDGLKTFNISTASALVAAGAGAIIAKHGNRAASSKSGSADVLEALGVKLELTAQQSETALAEMGITFLYARTHHPALRHAAQARQELGIRTIFNLIGPMTNPANAKRQLMGIFPGISLEKVALVLVKLGVERAMIVRGHDGMDEITLSGDTDVVEVNAGQLKKYTINPTDFGIQESPLEAILGGEAAQNAEIIKAILNGQKGPARDIVVLNAGAVIYLSGLAESHAEGILKAQEAIDSGAAKAKLIKLINFTNLEK